MSKRQEKFLKYWKIRDSKESRYGELTVLPLLLSANVTGKRSFSAMKHIKTLLHEKNLIIRTRSKWLNISKMIIKKDNKFSGDFRKIGNLNNHCEWNKKEL